MVYIRQYGWCERNQNCDSLHLLSLATIISMSHSNCVFVCSVTQECNVCSFCSLRNVEDNFPVLSFRGKRQFWHYCATLVANCPGERSFGHCSQSADQILSRHKVTWTFFYDIFLKTNKQRPTSTYTKKTLFIQGLIHNNNKCPTKRNSPFFSSEMYTYEVPKPTCTKSQKNQQKARNSISVNISSNVPIIQHFFKT